MLHGNHLGSRREALLVSDAWIAPISCLEMQFWLDFCLRGLMDDLPVLGHVAVHDCDSVVLAERPAFLGLSRLRYLQVSDALAADAAECRQADHRSELLGGGLRFWQLVLRFLCV